MDKGYGIRQTEKSECSRKSETEEGSDRRGKIRRQNREKRIKKTVRSGGERENEGRIKGNG